MVEMVFYKRQRGGRFCHDDAVGQVVRPIGRPAGDHGIPAGTWEAGIAYDRLMEFRLPDGNRDRILHTEGPPPRNLEILKS